MMREIVVKYSLLSASIMLVGGLVLFTPSHAESKDSIFGKASDHDFTPGGGDPAKGPGILDNAVIRLGNTVIRTGTEADQVGGNARGANADKERAARVLRNRSVDSGTPR